MGTRYDEDNVHIQCRACNRFRADDAKAAYATWMVANNYDLERLRFKALGITKFTDGELDVLLKTYRDKLKTIKENR